MASSARLMPELTPPSIEEELDRFGALLATGTTDEAQPDLASASAEEMFDILDNELEVP